jgi:hypothetical protein
MNQMRQRLWAIILGAAVAAPALAQEGTVELSAFPSIGVADGRTPITITAIVRDRGGNLVPNGTQVVFDSNLGTFKENLVTTEAGYARATLLASSLPGLARIRASVVGRFNASANLEFEFVADRAILDSARDFIEVTAPKKLVYSVADRIIEATSGTDETVVVLYRDTKIRGKDVQVKVMTYDVKARNAIISISGKDYKFDQLYYNLRTRKGFGVGRFMTKVPHLVQSGLLAAPIYEEREVLGPFEISAAEGIKRLDEVPDQRQLEFQSIVDSLSTVEARKAVAFPRKEVQFHQSNVKVGNVSIMKLPLFQVGTQSASPLVTDQMVQVTNNQIALNYPYYLSLKPGETSLLRFRYGNRFGAGVGASAGYFLDYELKWNHGDESEGAFALTGMNRKDWGVTLRQYYQADRDTTMTAQLDVPAHQSLFGNVNVNRLFNGFQANLNLMQGQSIGGQNRFQTNQYSLVVEKDPIKVKGLIPGNIFVGLSANSNGLRGEDFSSSQQTVGLQARFASRSLHLDANNTASFSFRLAQLSGQNVKEGLSQYGTVSLSSTLGRSLVLQTTYDFVNDGFNSELLGQHRLTTEAYYNAGRTNVRGYLAKTLDMDRISATAAFDYRFNSTWSFYYNYYMDRYLGDAYTDQTFIVGYRIGFREVGLSYSARTKRIGIELLGTRF